MTKNISDTITLLALATETGRITNEVRFRILRRIGIPTPEQSAIGRARAIQARNENTSRWNRLMALRNEIEHELEPILTAKRETERDVFQIHFAVPTTPESVSVKILPPRPEPTIDWASWWTTATRRERSVKDWPAFWSNQRQLATC